MRALIVGASGQLGGHLRAQLRREGHLAIGTFRTHLQPGLVALDLADEAALRAALFDVRPDVVFLPAGWTWVDGNEAEPEKSLLLNATQPLALARLTSELGALFVTYSSDYVFDGTAGPYTEEDAPRPLNVYGRSKLALEEGLRELGGEYLLLRTTTLYGPELQGKNFVYQLVRRLRAGEPFTVPSDQVATPAYAPDLAAATLTLIEQGARGLWHGGGPDALDRGAFARLACEEFSLDPAKVTCLPTSELGQKAPRPLSAALDTSKLQAAGITIRGVKEGLRAMREAIEAGGWAPL